MVKHSYNQNKKLGQNTHFSNYKAFKDAASDVNKMVDETLLTLKSKSRQSPAKRKQMAEIEQKRKEALHLLKEIESILKDQEKE